MRFLSMAIASALFLLPTVTAQTPTAATTDDEQVRQTLSALWKALGDFDGPAFKATLDWPNMIVQSRPDKGTRAATANTDIAAFDEEMRRTMDQLPKDAKGDFYGSTITTMEVRFLNSSLAYAYHVCQLGGKGGNLQQTRRGNRIFEAVAVLRKTSEAPNPWKIILVTIPQ
ncbi:MAG: hypothetical protein M3539_07320 [Acidobacteriota bacterium]|nr:hypothetical protein [Acidobacteriota bacterium]